MEINLCSSVVVCVCVCVSYVCVLGVLEVSNRGWGEGEIREKE